MTYIKIGENRYPTVEINGRMGDGDWEGRQSKAITLEMDVNTAKTIFVNDVDWSIVVQYSEEDIVEYDNAEFSVAGDIIDHRNGLITVKMGTPTQGELLNMLMEGLDL